MQIVIDIPKELFEDIKANGLCGYSSDRDTVSKAIVNGTPLPKGHGRLIDEKDVIKIHNNDDRVWWENALDDIKEFVPTIIEADKGKEQEDADSD